VKVKEGDVSDGDELGVARAEFPDMDRAAGQDGNSLLGWFQGGGEEGRVTIGGSQARQRGELGNLLYEGKVGAVVAQQAS
jgi:hypothetical protein